MEMIWHHDKLVKKIRVFFPARQDTLNQQLGHLSHSEEFAPLPRGGRNEVRLTRTRSMRQLAHGKLQGLKPFLASDVTSGLKPGPPKPKTIIRTIALRDTLPSRRTVSYAHVAFSSGGPGFSPAIPPARHSRALAPEVRGVATVIGSTLVKMLTSFRGLPDARQLPRRAGRQAIEGLCHKTSKSAACQALRHRRSQTPRGWSYSRG